MEKGYNPPQETTPPYPGPPLNAPMYHPQTGYQPPGVYPPPGTYQQGFPAAPVGAVPVTTVTHVSMSPSLGDVPGQTVCPHCRQTVVTQTLRTPGLLAWTICAGLAIFGFVCCACIPFCIDDCQDVEHLCPICHRVIYVHKKM